MLFWYIFNVNLMKNDSAWSVPEAKIQKNCDCSKFPTLITFFVVRVDESVIVPFKGYLPVVTLIQSLLSFSAILGAKFCFCLGMLWFGWFWWKWSKIDPANLQDSGCFGSRRESPACGEFRTPKITEIGSVVAEILTFFFRRNLAPPIYHMPNFLVVLLRMTTSFLYNYVKRLYIFVSNTKLFQVEGNAKKNQMSWRFYCKLNDLFIFYIFSQTCLPINIWSFNFVQTIVVFKKAHLARNIEHCSKNVRFYEIPKKEQNFDKTQKKLRFFTEKTSKNNHFNSELQVVCA